MTSRITINYLKRLFTEKYGKYTMLPKPVEVLVTLTIDQFNELNTDLIDSTNPLLLLIEESDYMPIKPGSVLFTRISVPYLCEFIIEIGEEFEFGLLDRSFEGEETLED